MTEEEEFIQAKRSDYIGRQFFYDKYFKTKKLEEMNKKKILHIDMDGVIADFAKGINAIDPNLDMSEDTENYDDRSRIVDQICTDNPNVFHNLEPIPGSIETVKKLFDHFEVYFLSTPMWIVPESYSGKRIWIQRHFGEMASKKLILTHRKDLVIGDFLVDDRKRNGAGEFKGEHIHYGTTQFPNWDVVYEYLMEPKDITSEYLKWRDEYPYLQGSMAKNMRIYGDDINNYKTSFDHNRAAQARALAEQCINKPSYMDHMSLIPRESDNETKPLTDNEI